METKKDFSVQTHRSIEESTLEQSMVKLLKECPIPDDQMLSNLGLFLPSRELSRLLFMDFIFRQIQEVQGIVFDFGTRWGSNMTVFSALRGIYEPYNRLRKIVGFDTFSGFPKIRKEDGKSKAIEIGKCAVPEKYQDYLAAVLDCHEGGNPLPHIKKYEVCIGDAVKETIKYFKRYPETIVALVYFDMNLYEPTKRCLEIISNYLTKGSIVVFDELLESLTPGETIALREVIGLNNVRIKRYPFASRVSYFIKE